MICCPIKSVKNRAPKASSIDKAYALSDRAPIPEPLLLSPLIAGPFIVPVTRWVE